MGLHRTTPRRPLFLIPALLVGIAAGTAGAQEPAPTPTPAPSTARGGVPQLIFPVVGHSAFTDDYGDPRGHGRHAGNDIMAARRAPAVAVEAGTIRFHTTSSRAGCMLYLHGASGTSYLYVHLNNDLGMTNDNRGGCRPGTAFAPGLRSGARVAAGEPIGFVGDSGDANGITPHLHFEMHPNNGASINPFTHLNRAWRLLFAAPRRGQTSLWLKGDVLEQATAALRVNVRSLGVRSTGLRLNGISRPVSLGLSPLTQIDRAIGRLAGQGRATVWTELFINSLDAQLGKPGAITAERVLLSR